MDLIAQDTIPSGAIRGKFWRPTFKLKVISGTVDKIRSTVIRRGESESVSRFHVGGENEKVSAAPGWRTAAFVAPTNEGPAREETTAAAADWWTRVSPTSGAVIAPF